jgi:hypothetical protein
MIKYIPSLMFIVYGILMLYTSSIIGKDIINKGVSSKLINYHRFLLSLSSMCLGLGFLLFVLINRDVLISTLDNKREYFYLYSISITLLSFIFLVIYTIIYQEIKDMKLTSERIGKVTLFSVILNVFVSFVSLLTLFVPTIKNRIIEFMEDSSETTINRKIRETGYTTMTKDATSHLYKGSKIYNNNDIFSNKN